MIPNSDKILYLGQDEKVSVPVGRSPPLDAATKQSIRSIVGQYQRAIDADNDWNSETGNTHEYH